MSLIETRRISANIFSLMATVGLLAACGPAAVEPPQKQAPMPEPVVEQPAEVFVAPPPDPERLSGLNPREVVGLMGEPGLMRRDGPVQVMLFENHDCVLEVVFMEPDPDSHFAASHISARDRDGNPTDAQQCLIRVLDGGNWPDR